MLSTLTRSYILPTHEDFTNDNRLDWESAELHCLSTYNTHLLSIHNTQTFQDLRSKIIAQHSESYHFWIGLMNIAPNNNHNYINYTWSDASPFDFGTDLTSGRFPWFDERPEIPSKDRFVRLWGGSASLLWDDTNANNKYFWICNHDNDNNILTTNNSYNTRLSSKSDLDTFWRFVVIAILMLSFCILLLRIRSIYKNYKNRRTSSGSSVTQTQVTDVSFVESSNRKFRASTIPWIEQSMDNGNSQSLDLQLHQHNINSMSLQIEHDINTIDSMEGNLNEHENEHENVSIQATFDVNTMIPNSIVTCTDLEHSHSSYSTYSNDDDSNHSMSEKEHLTKKSFHSTMAAFDVRSFKMKRDEFKFELNGEYEYECMLNNLNDTMNMNMNMNTVVSVVDGSETNLENKNIAKDEFVVSGENSVELNNNNDKNIITLKKESKLSGKEIEIKANISQIMKNLKRMKNMSATKNNHD